MSERELEGAVAIVTGAARNIGRETALALADAGAAVTVHARTSRADAEAVVREIEEKGGRAIVATADLAEPGGARAMVEATVEAFGGLDILVNNAARRVDTSIEDTTIEEWREVLGSILDASFLSCQAAVPYLSKSERGAIVNIGGVAAFSGVGGRPAVVAAKAGIVGLTTGLAAELAGRGVTVNCVSPGYINTKRDHIPPHFKDRPVPLGRPGEPPEIAAAVRFLAGPSARYITGHTLHVNGGWYTVA